jgi:malonyl-ACP decarboxylase
VDKHVYVTGYGSVTPFGYGNECFLRALKANQSAITLLPKLNQLSPYLLHAALLPENMMDNVLSEMYRKKNPIYNNIFYLARRQAPHVQAAILASIEAFEMAKLHTSNIDPDTIGIIIGGQNTCQYLSFEQTLKFNESPSSINPKEAITNYDFNQIGILSELLNIKGQSFCIGANSASSAAAIIQASQLIQLGVLDCCLVLGALTVLSPPEITAFKRLGAMSSSSEGYPNSPFDQEASGFVYGQACGCLILENEKSIQTRGVIPKGKMLSSVFLLDASHQPTPNSKRQGDVMMRALENAKLNPSNIDYINAHATASPKGDLSELSAISAIFNLKESKINATKSIIGHTLGSAAVIEFIASIMQLEHGFLHKTYGLTRPINGESTLLDIGTGGVFSGRTALINSYGFGGINCSIIYEKN